MKITEELVSKIDTLLDQGLVCGLGVPIPGQMCVEAAICYALELPHTSDPQCVSNVIRQLKITLNDANWSSNIARAKGMRNLAILQLGTKDNFDDKEFARRVVLFTCKDFIPHAFKDEVWFTDELKQGIIDADDDQIALPRAMRAAANAARSTAVYTTNAYYAANAAANAAAYYTATAANDDAAAAAAAYAAYDANDANDANDADSVLLYFAKGIESILIDMNVPGKEFI